MSFSQFPWENRVFRIDRECYLLFLGMDEMDVKPFVRIGSSSWLDERVLEVISHTVITESFTGNPFAEVGLTHHYHGRYLGEPKIVEVIKSFFDRFHVKDPEIITYSEQEEREGRDHVYFYNTGNIVVTFDTTRLFDLYAREKADRHYNYYCSEILGIFRRNPLKWEMKDLKGKGFFVTDESLFFFDSGRLLGLKWDKNYFKILARAGWDPDKLEGILVDLKQDEMEGDKSAGVMNFIKRGISARNSMTFYSRDKTFSSKIEPLFEYVQSRDVPINFMDISDQGCFNWHGTQGEWKEGHYSFQIAENIKASMNEAGRINLDFDDNKRNCEPLKNVPSRIHQESLGLEKLCRLYVQEVSLVLLKSGMTGNPVRFVRDVSLITTALQKGVNEKQKALSVPLEKQLGEVKSLIRAMGRNTDERIAILSSNCATLLELLADNDSDFGNKSSELAAQLRKIVSSPTGQAEGFLYSANYYEKGCFYLPCKLDISPGDRAKASDMHEALLRCDKEEVEFFFSERKRLEEMLAGLNDGTLWEDIKKYNDQKTLVQDQGKTTASSESKSSVGSKTTAVPPTQGKVNSKKSGGSQSSGKSKLWLLLLLLLLLIGGGGYLTYDYFNKGNSSVISNLLNNTAGDAVDKERGVTDDPLDTQEGDKSSEVGNTDAGNNEKNNPVGNQDSGNLNQREGSTGTSPLSSSDTELIPSENGVDDPEVVFKDQKDTQVTKPFVMDEKFLEDFMVDGILITMADIHLKANDIAVMNGYRDLGFHKVEGRDPTIIEPGLVLKIPGSMTYSVKRDDNIWYIAARLLESELRDFTARFRTLTEEFDKSVASGKNGESQIENLQALRDMSNCENFRKKVENWLNNR